MKCIKISNSPAYNEVWLKQKIGIANVKNSIITLLSRFGCRTMEFWCPDTKLYVSYTN